MTTIPSSTQKESDWICPVCNKSDKIFGLSGSLWELNGDKLYRSFDRICERCRYFFDANTKSGRTY